MGKQGNLKIFFCRSFISPSRGHASCVDICEWGIDLCRLASMGFPAPVLQLSRCYLQSRISQQQRVLDRRLKVNLSIPLNYSLLTDSVIFSHDLWLRFKQWHSYRKIGWNWLTLIKHENSSAWIVCWWHRSFSKKNSSPGNTMDY